MAKKEKKTKKNSKVKKSTPQKTSKTKINQEQALENFKKIPGVGKIISQYFWDIGCSSFDDLKKYGGDDLYKTICKKKNIEKDHYLLYVCRCAIYYVSNEKHDPELLVWWHWKDKEEKKSKPAKKKENKETKKKIVKRADKKKTKKGK